MHHHHFPSNTPAINFLSLRYYVPTKSFPSISITFNSMAQNNPQRHQPSLNYEVAKASTAIALGGSLQLLSGLTLTGTVMSLALVTPLLVLFSPVLVPAAITLFFLFAGFVTSGCLGSAGAFVLYWMYSYAVGKYPIGAQKLDQLTNKIASIVKNKEGQGGEEDWAAHKRMIS